MPTACEILMNSLRSAVHGQVSRSPSSDWNEAQAVARISFALQQEKHTLRASMNELGPVLEEFPGHIGNLLH
jgi:hypothetical protein